MNRPQCQEVRQRDFEPCMNPAKYYVDAPAYKNKCFFVCGIHARGFTAEALHPLRIKDLSKLTEREAKQ